MANPDAYTGILIEDEESGLWVGYIQERPEVLVQDNTIEGVTEKLGKALKKCLLFHVDRIEIKTQLV